MAFSFNLVLERNPIKWLPLFGIIARKYKILEQGLKSIKTHEALETLKRLWQASPIFAKAAIAGALCALAHPPFGFLPGLFGYGLLLWLLDKQAIGKDSNRAKKSFFLGWIAGIAYFLIGCFWVFEAFMVDAQTYGWMAPFAVVFLASVPGVFWGFTALFYQIMPKPVSEWRHLLFAGLFTLFEIVRGFIFTGFPWNPAGASFKAGSAISQIAALVGVYGLTLLIVLAFSSVIFFRPKGGLKANKVFALSISLIIIGFIFGTVRLVTTSIEPSSVRIRLVQPNVAQKIKWTRGGFEAIFNTYISLSKAAPKNGGKVPEVIIWPEGALPAAADDLFAENAWTAPIMANLLASDQILIMGAYHSDWDEKKGQVWRNSMLILRKVGKVTRIEGVYSKYKLVPFGEFTPLEDLLAQTGLKTLAHIGDSYTPGPRTHSLKVEGLVRILPLICYEGIFPSLDMSAYKNKDDPNRPHMIINISNDAWFGPTTGPLQHLNLASYRAIEEGLPLIRSTPTGISANISPMGKLVPGDIIPTGQGGFIDFYPAKAISPPLYTHIRNFGAAFLSFFCLIFVSIGPFVAHKVEALRNRGGESTD